jgi:glucosyl-dolichyl phosphate glucuronosyltransferase
MNITVILCTYNRCQSIGKALDSIAASALPDSVNWEVLVVDNNSSDQTREVVSEVRRGYPGRFRYLFEPRSGKSHALNTGIREAHGDILVFVDDDVTVEPTWLENLTVVLRDNDEWAGAGGRIVLQWPALLPRWLSVEGPHARFPFPAFNQGHEAKQLIGPPFGTNMAFRKEMFQKYGNFRTDLGPSPNDEVPRPSEDTEFGRRLIAGGERLRYEPLAIVYHPVAEERITKSYFLKWSFDLGRANIRTLGIRPGTKWFVGGIPLYLLRRLTAWTTRWLFTLESSRRFSHKVIAWEKAGEIVECRRQTRTLKSGSGTSAKCSAGSSNESRPL